MAVDAALADLAHQVHAHGVAAKRKEGAVAQAQDAAVPPDQVKRNGEHGVAEVLAKQRHGVGGDVEHRVRRYCQVGDRHDDRGDGQHGEQDPAAPLVVE